MTTQTKTFIELSDILTLKFTCDDCGCTLSIPVSRDLSKSEEKNKLDTCPMCRLPWLSHGQNSYLPSGAGFVTGLNTLQSTLSNKIGFSLALELAQPPEEE